ncbi:16S rRNA (cytosine(1402)-N(4))-methyltransferase RsmH [Granulosicoccaceae sp. 1_MG-2023]|nr:16S rRNA (cytosine(1402)-N(4))-methyltransferase RsmH [Granulosicoccaceae sp. 1_MG-2023]
MMQGDGTHVPVLLSESVEALAIHPDGIYLDATYGRGGHSDAILRELGSAGRLISLDQDPQAVAEAQVRHGHDPRFSIVHTNFSALTDVCEQLGVAGRINGILLDLGVSSPQLDAAERGFSFTKEGPLDMRMNPQAGVSARQWLAEAELQDMVRVFREYGEERYAPRIARAIIRAREEQPIETTLQLASIVRDAHPRWEKNKHPATRVFQAIRIHVNDELGVLRRVLSDAGDMLVIGGRLSVISFHSLEDRLVKRFIRTGFDVVDHPRHLPPPTESRHPFKAVGKAVFPSEEETARNIRSRSAVLRVAEKCA